MKKYICEFIGTMVLVLFGCGTAVLTGADIVATSLAFGLSIVALAYVIGNVSGCHVNPAVSFAMYLDKRLSGKDLVKYIIAQVLGAIAGAALLALIINSIFSLGDYNVTGLGQNSFGKYGINMLGAFIVETVLTFVFIYTILGVTKDKKKDSVAGIVIGLTLAFVHLFGIKLTGTSVNPARSLGPALLLGQEALEQVWLFILAPMFGAALATFTFKYLNSEKKSK
ncbi:MAG: MIP family channel protein [Bacilli bacterium]|nr:MIP family channel protein [Bacilli bacterium]